jgi:hypothetical protein
MSWAKRNLSVGIYHYYDLPLESICGLKNEGNEPVVEHKVIQDRGKCKKCLKIIERRANNE